MVHCDSFDTDPAGDTVKPKNSTCFEEQNVKGTAENTAIPNLNTQFLMAQHQNNKYLVRHLRQKAKTPARHLAGRWNICEAASSRPGNRQVRQWR